MTTSKTAKGNMAKKKAARKKVVLAFSGGLDTSYLVVYLKEMGYDIVTVTVDTGGLGQKAKAVGKRSAELGAIKHYSIDARNDVYEQVIQYLIKLNGLYEGQYPVMCADRYVIVQKILEVAKKEKAPAVAHGCTAVGNDQVRFDSALRYLAPDMEVITPVRDLRLKRDAEIAYLKKRGFGVDSAVKKYSINENIFGVTVSGSEVDKNEEPGSEAYTMTKPTKKGVTYVTLGFESGLPVSLNGKKMGGMAILKELNQLVGAYGAGSNIYTGDCVIGIKGRIMFEAPGLFALIDAHSKLEQLTLTKQQLSFNRGASWAWADLVYNGLYYEPLVKDIQAYADSVQAHVSGVAKLKLEQNKMSVVEANSPNSMIKEGVATYAQAGSWSADEVKGFIRFHSMQQNLA